MGISGMFFFCFLAFWTEYWNIFVHSMFCFRFQFCSVSNEGKQSQISARVTLEIIYILQTGSSFKDASQSLVISCRGEWNIHRKNVSKLVCYWLQPETTHDWVVNIRQSWRCILGLEWCLTVAQGMCHSSTCPPNVQLRHCMWTVIPGLSPR